MIRNLVRFVMYTPKEKMSLKSLCILKNTLFLLQWSQNYLLIKNYKLSNINFLWGHNNHVADLQLSNDNLFYIKNEYANIFTTPKVEKEITQNNYQVIDFIQKFCQKDFIPSWLNEKPLDEASINFLDIVN